MTAVLAAAPPDAPPIHFLTLDELGPGGLSSLLDPTGRLKRDPDAFRNRLAGGRIGMFFDKPSTRTRVSFESAAWLLGMLPIDLRPDELQLGRGETVADTAPGAVPVSRRPDRSHLRAVVRNVTAAAEFVRRTGTFAAIGALEDARAMLEGRARTRLVASIDSRMRGSGARRSAVQTDRRGHVTAVGSSR